MAAPKGNKFHQKGEEAATSFIQCRVTPTDKSMFVKAAQADGLKLCEWMMKTMKSALK